MPYSPSLREEKGPGDELVFRAIAIHFRFGHWVLVL